MLLKQINCQYIPIERRASFNVKHTNKLEFKAQYNEGKKNTKVKWFSLYMYQHLIWSHYFFYLVFVCAGDGGCLQFATSTGNNTKERRIEDNVMNAMNWRLLFSRSLVVHKQSCWNNVSLCMSFVHLSYCWWHFFPYVQTQSKNCFNNSRKKIVFEYQ